MNDVDIAWVAGLLEGEGSFLFKKSGEAPLVSCHMTDLDVLEKLQNLCGGKIYTVSKRKDHWKQSWVWYVSHANAARLMKDVLPYMASRRSQKIKCLLEAWYLKQNQMQLQKDIYKQAGLDYQNKKGSLRDIAKQYNISATTVHRAYRMLSN